jgi:hypothetical protein
MAAQNQENIPVATVDYLIDENASVIDVPDGSVLVPTKDVEQTIAATAPTTWWQVALIALGIVAAILLVLQLLGGSPGTDVQPGTPVAAPTEPAAPNKA